VATYLYARPLRWTALGPRERQSGQRLDLTVGEPLAWLAVDATAAPRRACEVTRMRIAQVAPLAESVPPKFYGGTERVVSWLTEELVIRPMPCCSALTKKMPRRSGAEAL
jgi:hypothetical protein